MILDLPHRPSSIGEPEKGSLQHMSEKLAESGSLSRASDSPHEGGPSVPDLAFGLVLFLTLTDLYRFIAPWAGFRSLAPLTAVFTLAAIAYATYYWPYACVPVSRLVGWTTFLLVVPLASLVYSVDPSFRDGALQVFYLSLLWASKAFFTRSGTTPLRGLLLEAALLVGFVGVVLSIIHPALFATIARMTAHPSPYREGRGYGFFLQSNACAASLTFLMFLWLFVRKPRRLWHSLLVVVVYVLAIFLTGSRGGIVTATFLLGSYVLFVGPEWDWRALGTQVIRFSVLGGIGSVFLVGVVFVIVPRLAPDGAAETLRRIRSLADYRYLMHKDESIRGRLEAQRAYLAGIAERPFLGCGMGSALVLHKQGFLPRSSHNMFVEYSFAYGAVGLVVWLALSWMTWQDCFALRHVLHHKIHFLFFGMVFLACMTSDAILVNRVLYVAFGWLLAQRYPDSSAGPSQGAGPPEDTERATER